ncbi:MAG: hypothetical protein WAX69_15940 [Victivallales bacterium]
MAPSTETLALTRRIVAEYETIGDNAGRDKFRHIKNAIIKSLVASAADDRFPAIRALSGALGVTPVPVQKAVTELIAENRLYSKGRVGLFVKTPTAGISRNTAVGQKVNFDILFNEKSEYIHGMMVPLLERLRKQLSRLEIGLFFEPDAKDSFDIYIQNELPPETVPLNLADSVRHEIRRGNLVLSDPCTAPLANQTHYFIWNRDLLKKKKVPEPAYATFAEQREYFHLLNRSFEIPVLSWLRPDYLIGKRITEILGILKSGCSCDAPEAADTVHLLNEIQEFCGCWEYEKTNHAVNSFLHGKRPGMILPTTSLFSLKPAIKNFELGYYHMVGHDDALILVPVPIKMPARYDAFYEGVQIMKALQSEEIQRIFWEEDYVTVHGKGKHLPDSLQHAGQDASVILCGNDRDSYLRHTVMHREMLMTGIYRKDHRAAIENIFDYSHSIANNFQEDDVYGK